MLLFYTPFLLHVTSVIGHVIFSTVCTICTCSNSFWEPDLYTTWHLLQIAHHLQNIPFISHFLVFYCSGNPSYILCMDWQLARSYTIMVELLVNITINRITSSSLHHTTVAIWSNYNIRFESDRHLKENIWSTKSIHKFNSSLTLLHCILTCSVTPEF